MIRDMKSKSLQTTSPSKIEPRIWVAYRKHVTIVQFSSKVPSLASSFDKDTAKL